MRTQLDVSLERVQALWHYSAALQKTNALIDLGERLPKEPAAVRARAEARLERLRRLLSALGNPHLAYPVLHIGGTSGKGSTAAMAASLLGALGFRTGLHTSPYLQVATEKIQIDGQLVAAETLHDLVREVLEASEATGIGPVAYGEAWFAIVALAFARERVDAAVIEVGAGGRFDLTNVVESRVAVITSVGLDHTETLGTTIPEIAWHKAGIIKPGRPIVSAVRDPDALTVIENEAALRGSRLIQVAADQTFSWISSPEHTLRWWELDRPDSIFQTLAPGSFGATNAATALAAVRAFVPESMILEPRAIRAGQLNAELPGRFEVMQSSPAVILDGAHNPEKIRALTGALSQWLATRGNPPVTLVFGSLEAKDHLEMLAILLPLSARVIFTEPEVIAKSPTPLTALVEDAKRVGYQGELCVTNAPRDALAQALELVRDEEVVLVTGSLYLLGNVRGRWFPDEEVLIQRTCWPFV